MLILISVKINDKLKKTDASSTYLSKTDASNTYQPKGSYAAANHTHGYSTIKYADYYNTNTGVNSNVGIAVTSIIGVVPLNMGAGLQFSVGKNGDYAQIGCYNVAGAIQTNASIRYRVFYWV